GDALHDRRSRARGHVDDAGVVFTLADRPPGDPASPAEQADQGRDVGLGPAVPGQLGDLLVASAHGASLRLIRFLGLARSRPAPTGTLVLAAMTQAAMLRATMGGIRLMMCLCAVIKRWL